MTEEQTIKRAWSADAVEVAVCRDSMTKQRREGKASSLTRAETSMGTAAVADAWIRKGQKRMNRRCGVKRSPDGYRKGAE
jgi:hypothetical protein